MERRFGQEVDEELLKERRNAQRRACAAAWEAEKAEASANKVWPCLCPLAQAARRQHQLILSGLTSRLMLDRPAD